MSPRGTPVITRMSSRTRLKSARVIPVNPAAHSGLSDWVRRFIYSSAVFFGAFKVGGGPSSVGTACELPAAWVFAEEMAQIVQAAAGGIGFGNCGGGLGECAGAGEQITDGFFPLSPGQTGIGRAQEQG